MPTITAPLVETKQVVTGIMYEITVNEESNGSGITRLEIGPYRFSGTPPQIKYPEAPTNELSPPDFKPLRWVTLENGDSFLRYDGGRILPEDGNVMFIFSSNFPPSMGDGPQISVYRDGRREDFQVPCPDYTQKPPARNSRHDSQGLGMVYKSAGCLPQTVLFGAVALAAVIHFVK